MKWSSSLLSGEVLISYHHYSGQESGIFMDKSILTLQEACKLLRVSESTMRRWLRDKKIQAYKMEGQWRFLKYELDEWMEKDKNVASTSTPI